MESSQLPSLSRREFILLSAASATAMVSGCATNPVTGKRQLMFISEKAEIDLDRKWAPHQFSTDYGAVRDERINGYISGVGNRMAELTHRPHMPYNFRAVNSVVVNGYTMPAGSMALARGLMLEMDNEAELAAVLGHELGHVNARHAGERMTKNIMLTAMVAGITAYVQKEHKKYEDLAAGLGGIGAGLLLSRYSRDDEREADALGLEYTARGGHNPSGMVQLMDAFRSLRKKEPTVVDLLFSTHPMSTERYETALKAVKTEYRGMSGRDVRRERYMDMTASVRRIRQPIKQMQMGNKLMMKKDYAQAEGHFRNAIRGAPEDYAGLLMLAKCYLAQSRNQLAAEFAERARSVYPEEAQAFHVGGMSALKSRRFEAAMEQFAEYEGILPGNPNTVFYRGFCFEQMEQPRKAAEEYMRYHKQAPTGEFGQFTQNRLTEWGYMAPAEQQ